MRKRPPSKRQRQPSLKTWREAGPDLKDLQRATAFDPRFKSLPFLAVDLSPSLQGSHYKNSGA